MPKSFADLSKQIIAIFKTLTAGKLIALAILIAAMVAGLVVLISWSHRLEYMPLYTQLSAQDAGEVVAKLRELKIPYQLSHDGSTVQIPQEHIYDMRLELASQGIPKGSGIGFEVFDNTKLGTTEFVQNINYQRALQGELSRTINGLSEVESSRVHIVMAPRSLFIEDEEPATASVILKLRHGQWLSDDQIQGIVHLVSSSVARLNPENVTVVDQNGKLLAGVQDQPSHSKISSDQLEYQQRKEQLLQRQVMSMLEKVLGKDKAIVRVACSLDFMQQEKTEEMFFPDNQVVRSEQLLNEQSAQAGANPAGVPGLASNISVDNPVETKTASSMGFKKADTTRNYEIGKMTSRKVMPIGNLQQLSVAVIVDGTYETIITGKGEEQKEEIKYIPRKPEEMAKLESIVKRAVNFDESRGDKVEVVNISFNTDKIISTPEIKGMARWMDWLKSHAEFIKYLVAALFVVFAFVFIVRPLIQWLTDTSWEDVELLEHLPRTIAEIENQYGQNEEQVSFVNQAAQLLESDKENSAQLMQQWLKEQ